MTVGELIDMLKAYPASRRVVLQDPDTGWWLKVQVRDATGDWAQQDENSETPVAITGEYEAEQGYA